MLRVGELRRHEPRQAEVEDLDRAALGDEDVRRLDVAMDDAAAVGVLEALADLDREIDFPRQAHLLGPRSRRCRSSPSQVLHRQVGLPLVLAEIVDRDDVLVRQLTGGARLAKEALAHLRVRFDGARDDLDRRRRARSANRRRDRRHPCRPVRASRGADSGQSFASVEGPHLAETQPLARWRLERGKTARTKAG